MKDFKNVKITIDNKNYIISGHASDSGRFGRKMRIHLFPQNETIIENLQNRRNRDRSLWRKISLLTLHNLNLSNVKLTFSQKAGCFCGCSPGFIANLKNGQELFINYKEVK